MKELLKIITTYFFVFLWWIFAIEILKFFIHPNVLHFNYKFTYLLHWMIYLLGLIAQFIILNENFERIHNFIWKKQNN